MLESAFLKVAGILSDLKVELSTERERKIRANFTFAFCVYNSECLFT